MMEYSFRAESVSESQVSILGIVFWAGGKVSTVKKLHVDEVTKMESLKKRFVGDKNHGDGPEGTGYKRAHKLWL